MDGDRNVALRVPSSVAFRSCIFRTVTLGTSLFLLLPPLLTLHQATTPHHFAPLRSTSTSNPRPPLTLAVLLLLFVFSILQLEVRLRTEPGTSFISDLHSEVLDIRNEKVTSEMCDICIVVFGYVIRDVELPLLYLVVDFFRSAEERLVDVGGRLRGSLHEEEVVVLRELFSFFTRNFSPT